MLNTITIMGRLTKEPELRYTQSQTPVVSFTVACDRDYSNDNEGRKTDFIDCVAWRHTAEFVSNYFHKGGMAAVHGRLQIRDWKDQNGNNRRSAEILVDSIYFGESKRDMTEKMNTGLYEEYGAQGDFEGLSDNDGELPF